METVYIVGIIAGAIVFTVIIVVWLLRDRITGGRFRGSVTEQAVEAEIEAAAPAGTAAPGEAATAPSPAPPPSPAAKTPSVDISGNWLIGIKNVIRVLRGDTRVARNPLLGKEQRIEVKDDPPPPALPPKKKKSKKRKK